jgi:hypothetical protein
VEPLLIEDGEGDVKEWEVRGCVEMKFCSRFSRLNIYLLQVYTNELVRIIIFLQFQQQQVEMSCTATDI